MKRGGAEGFTLVELLVALALLGLMTAYAVAALRSLRDVSRATDELEARAEVEAVVRHLRQSLADTRAIFVNEENGAAQLVFSGGPARIGLITVMNDRLERGGLYALDYGIDDKGKALTLKRRLYRPDGQAPVAEESLLEGIESVAFRYCEATCTLAPNDWPESWKPQDRLPGFVRITVAFPKTDTRRWPELVVPLAAGF
jgi:general secretion pathway protein J